MAFVPTLEIKRQKNLPTSEPCKYKLEGTYSLNLCVFQNRTIFSYFRKEKEHFNVKLIQ